VLLCWGLVVEQLNFSFDTPIKKTSLKNQTSTPDEIHQVEAFNFSGSGHCFRQYPLHQYTLSCIN
ncbi:hypothetical protein, partial [Klebsiella pneumoniae]